MYDELFDMDNLKYDWMKITDKNEIANILNIYINEYYDETDSKDEWFEKIKQLTNRLGYAANMKDYKENPDDFKGNVTDISTVIRVALTSKAQTPDLYMLLKLIGKERILKRFNKFIK